jgi:hypothetical protein
MQLLRKFVVSLRTRGIAATTKVVANHVATRLRYRRDRAYDRKHGTDTCGIVPLETLNIVGDNKGSGVHHEPTSPPVFRHIMEKLRSEMAFREFVFIDYGSGKGRALLLASEYDFESIVGVEFAQELHEIAGKNIHAYQPRVQACNTITSIHADAARFSPPPGNLLVYFFNPFLGDVISSVLVNIRDSRESKPSKIALVYLSPVASDVIEKCGMFQRSLELDLPRDYVRDAQGACKVYFNW